MQVPGALTVRAAVLVVAGNLYAVGPTDSPMRESDRPNPSTALGHARDRSWRLLREAHEAGQIRAAEIRGSDYLGPGPAERNVAGTRLTTPLLTGRTAWTVGDLDAPHTFTSTIDFGRLLARAAVDASMWGRVWHVPSAPAVTQRELARTILRVGGTTGEPKLRAYPAWVLRALGLASPILQAVGDMSYQFRAPFVMDDADARTLLGETHTPIEESLRAQLAESAPGAGASARQSASAR